MSELRNEGDQKTTTKFSQAYPVCTPWSLRRVSLATSVHNHSHSHMHSLRSARTAAPTHSSVKSPTAALRDFCLPQHHRQSPQLEPLAAETRLSSQGDNLGLAARCSPCSSARPVGPDARASSSGDSFPASSPSSLRSEDVEKTRPKTASLWDAHGQLGFIAWDRRRHYQPRVAQRACSESPHPRLSLTHAGSPSGMGGASMRRCRQWAGVCLPLAAFFYIVLYCNSAVWSSLSMHHHPLHNTLSGSGFRKLLEDQERARLSTNVSNAALTQRLPSCIIIGVRKCGTRALLEFLNLHPDIVTAEDEMHFFNDDERYRMGLDWYRHHMPLSQPHQITIEKTPGYFISPITPSRIHRMNNTVKLIVLVRHPTTRTISDYTQIYYNKQFKNETLDAFEDIAICRDSGTVNTRYKAVQISMYHHHFRHWMDIFPRHQIHVVDGDRLITDPVSEIAEIETFLGLEHRINYNMLYFNSTRGFYCMRMNATHERCLGASKGRKHPDIEQSVIWKLNRFFQPHNKQLFDLIQQRFPWS